MPQPAATQPDAGARPVSGVRKAAILLLTLSEVEAAALLKRLPPEAVEQVGREISSLGEVPPHLRNSVFHEFYHLALANSYLARRGPEDTQHLRARPGEGPARHSTPFSFLQKADSRDLMAFIQDEHPQTIALILAHLPPAKASEILIGLPGQKQIEIVRRIANMQDTNPEVIREVEHALQHRLSDIVSQNLEKTGGLESVAEMLNLAGRATEKGIMEGLEAEDPDLVLSIRRLMFTFEDLCLLEEEGIRAVLKEVDNETLALALRTASSQLRDSMFGSMSERARKLLQEDMQYMGPVRISDVEAAQQKIVDTVRRLEEAGELIVEGRAGEKELLV